MSRIPSTIISRRLAVAYAIVVIALSSFPGLDLPDVGRGGLDKVLHFAQYGVLGFLVSRGWGPWRADGATGLMSWLPALILLGFAGADEYHQHWIPGRYPEWLDWTADITGVLIGYIVGGWRNHRTRSRMVRANRIQGNPSGSSYQSR